MSSAKPVTSEGSSSARWALVRDALGIVLTGVVLGVVFNALELSSRPPRGLAWIPAVQRLDDVDSLIRLAGPPEMPESPALVSRAPSLRRPVPAASAAPIIQRPVAVGSASPRASTPREAGLAERSRPNTPEPASPPPSGTETVRTAVPMIPDLGRPLRIELPLVSELVAAGAALVVDARDPPEFAEGHIAGAINIPYDQAMADPARIDALDAGGRPIVVYCSGGTCESSRYLAELLVREFHKQRVLVYEGGFPEWAAAGKPVTKGTD